MRRWAVRVPAALLLVVAATQMVLARTADLSPWKGGGFGMFASIDGVPFRWVRLYVFAAERSEEIDLPLSLDDQARRTATWPRAQSLQQLAHDIVAREQRQQRPVQSVRVEIWRAEVSTSLDVTQSLLKQVTVVASEPDVAGPR